MPTNGEPAVRRSGTMLFLRTKTETGPGNSCLSRVAIFLVDLGYFFKHLKARYCQENWHGKGPFFDQKDPHHRLIIQGIGAKAVDSLGRIDYHSATDDKASSTGDHDSFPFDAGNIAQGQSPAVASGLNTGLANFVCELDLELFFQLLSNLVFGSYLLALYLP